MEEDVSAKRTSLEGNVTSALLEPMNLDRKDANVGFINITLDTHNKCLTCPIECDCNQIGALDNECDLITGQCKCQANTYGRECDQCQPGFWNFTSCEQCNCNGHTQTCNAKTGECNDCADYTTGFNCDRCIDGFYGDPLLGSEVGCRACHCPNTVASGHSHASQCDFDSRNQDMVCYCKEGYAGARCDVCADNYFGHPEKPGGSCEKCECNDNVDLNAPGNCDSHTGECLKCLANTAGPHCEICSDDFYGDALDQSCTRK